MDWRISRCWWKSATMPFISTMQVEASGNGSRKSDPLHSATFPSRQALGSGATLAYDFALMPFAFESPAGIIQTVFADDARGPTAKLQKLLTDTKQAFPFDAAKPFNVGVEVELRFVRKASDGAITVRVATGDPNAVPVTITEEDARKAFPWTYSDLRSALHRRYSDFKENDLFHRIRTTLERDTRYCHVRQLDTKNPKSHKQRFYNPNILGIFDEHYTRVAGGPSERTSFKALGASGQHGPWRAGVQEMARGPVRRRAMLSSGCPR